MASPVLNGEGVTKFFGGLRAVCDINFELNENEILSLIGPNGAGKSTLFNLITGYYHPTEGRIKFLSKDITRLKPHQICRMGIARTFQLVKSFENLTAQENVSVGHLFGRKPVRGLGRAKEESGKLLDFVGLQGSATVPAKSLTLADRRRLELARAVACSPKVLLLDEVMAGLSATETAEAVSLIRRIQKNFGISIFLIEHVMSAVMDLSDRIIVLNYGQKLAEGSPKEISENPHVIEAYLGESSVAGSR
jgi:branched-chain amino acid transport system ATP-binding protein